MCVVGEVVIQSRLLGVYTAHCSWQGGGSYGARDPILDTPSYISNDPQHTSFNGCTNLQVFSEMKPFVWIKRYSM